MEIAGVKSQRRISEFRLVDLASLVGLIPVEDSPGRNC